jgi:hypothetical protein
MTDMELETEHEDNEGVARAVSPDNTDEIETGVKDGAVVTRIERDDIESAGATADDYLRNVVVADELLNAL